MPKIALTILFFVSYWNSFGQLQSINIQPISIGDDDNFLGYDLIETEGIELFALGEHWHNIKSVPLATLKLLRYLNKYANVRILAIEQGKSVAWMINQYLKTGNRKMLEHITRNTMFWAREHRLFFEELRKYNLEISEEKQIIVKSIDIEYKMESAVFVINEFIKHKKIPNRLIETVGEFKRIYEETKEERESYDGISVMFYYDRDFIRDLLMRTIADLEEESKVYIDFFGEDFTAFATMILEMDDGLTFDYTNANQKYKFRDKIIYQNFIELIEENTEAGILCPIGLRHVEKGSSINHLKTKVSSPLHEKVAIIRISALYTKSINAGDLRKINFNYPKQLKKNSATLIHHDEDEAFLKSKKYDYTIFINENGSVTPFDNVLTEQY